MTVAQLARRDHRPWIARRSARRRRDADPLARFLRYLEEIEDAVLARDAMRITALLRKRTATHLPREVREELLAISRMPRDSLRAPVQFLRFQHRMTQLAAGGERLPTAQTRAAARSAARRRARSAGRDERRAARGARSEPTVTPDDADDGPHVTLPVKPGYAPMEARVVDELPDGRRVAVRAQVGRLPVFSLS